MSRPYSYSKSPKVLYGRSSALAKKPLDDATPLYGTTYTSKISYRKKRVSRKRARAGRKKTGKFLYQSMKLQNAQNAIFNNAFQGATVTNQQAWVSLDLCSTIDLYQLFRTQFGPGVGEANFRDFRMALQSFNLKYYITNTTSTPVELDIYHITPRRDMTTAEMLVSPTGPSNGNLFANWMNTAYARDSIGTPDGEPLPTVTSLGWTPFMYRNLCRMFSINKVRSIKMGPFETFTARDRIKSRMLNAAQIGITTPKTGNPAITDVNKLYLKGVSRIVMIKIRGFPIDSAASPPSTLDFAWETTSTSKVVLTRPGSDALIGDA